MQILFTTPKLQTNRWGEKTKRIFIYFLSRGEGGVSKDWVEDFKF